MKKLERIACLYLTFLNNPEGLSFSEIKDFIAGAYEGESESARRKFERDKEDLRKMGMPLKHYSDGTTLPDSRIAVGHVYIPEKETVKLPEISLTDEQARTLSSLLFGAIARYEGVDHDMAMKLRGAATKLLYKNPASVPQPLRVTQEAREIMESEDFPRKLELAHEALREHKVLHLEYPGHDGELAGRDVEGRGLLAHRGRWCLVAFCRKAKDIRHFYLDRLGEMNMLEEVYRPDKKFNLKNVSLHPLAIRIHAPVEVKIALNEEKEDQFHDFVTGVPESSENSIRHEEDAVVFSTTNRRALFSWMIRQPGVVEKLGPEAIRNDFMTYLEEMKAIHEGAG